MVLWLVIALSWGVSVIISLEPLLSPPAPLLDTLCTTCCQYHLSSRLFSAALAYSSPQKLITSFTCSIIQTRLCCLYSQQSTTTEHVIPLLFHSGSSLLPLICSQQPTKTDHVIHLLYCSGHSLLPLVCPWQPTATDLIDHTPYHCCPCSQQSTTDHIPLLQLVYNSWPGG